MSIAQKKQQTLIKRRKRAVLLSVAALVLLAVALFFVLQYVNTFLFEDLDGTTYYVRKNEEKQYALYNKEKELMPKEDAYGCYVTALGTLVQVDAESGAATIFAAVDIEGTEVYESTYSGVLMFPHIPRETTDPQMDYLLSIEVHNASDSYTFVRYDTASGKISADGDFVITRSPASEFDTEKFATLCTDTGYTLTKAKIKPIQRDANGNLCGHEEGSPDCACTNDYAEYGLVSELRVDEDGKEYTYEPTYYVLTSKNGVKHKVIVGDQLVTGDGYYARYVAVAADGTETPREAVYVMDDSTGTSVNANLEYYMTPRLAYPMTTTDYFDVQNFTVKQRLETAKPGDSDIFRDSVPTFSYVDLLLRENTMQSTVPYVFVSEQMQGYTPSSDNIDTCLKKIQNASMVAVHKLGPSSEDMVKYGFNAPITDEQGNPKTDESGNLIYASFADYSISYDFNVKDSEDNLLYTVNHLIVISDEMWDEETGEYVKNGNYYAYTVLTKVTEKDGKRTLEPTGLYDMIVEVEGHTLSFLEWDSSDWLTQTIFNTDISYITEIKVESAGYSASFTPDNSASDLSSGANSNYMSVTGSDTLGRSFSSFGLMKITDQTGKVWHITQTDFTVYTASGTQVEVKSDYWEYLQNAMNMQTKCLKNYSIICDGYRVDLTANYIHIQYNDGRTESICRYQTNQFRRFYQTMLRSSIIDSYEMTAEQETALLNDPAALYLTVTVTAKDADGTVVTNVYRFYRLTDSTRKMYITVNGIGGFYVMSSRVEKLISDAQKVFTLETINPSAKN